jgi:hypothetical protein
MMPWLICLALTGFAGTSLVAEDEKKAEEETAKAASRPTDEGKVIVITNEYLEKRFGGDESEVEEGAPSPEAAAPASPAAGSETAGKTSTVTQPVDPLTWMENRKAQQTDWQRQVSEAEVEVAEAQKKVADLEYRLRATRIPFLARPEIPEEERAEWKAQSASERAATTQSQLDTARAELDTATQKLERLKSQKP